MANEIELHGRAVDGPAEWDLADDNVTPLKRRQEVARILAEGYLRLVRLRRAETHAAAATGDFDSNLLPTNDLHSPPTQ